MRRHGSLTSSFTMWSILLFLGSAAMGAGVFMVTQSAKQRESGIDDINKSILAERQSIRVLEAEWAYLSRPQRLEELMAMRKDEGVMPPAPAPISTVVSDAPAEVASTVTTPASEIAETKPAAGTSVATPEDVKAAVQEAVKEPVKEPEAKPVKKVAEAVKAPAKAKPEKKVAKAEPKAAPLKTAAKKQDDLVWSPKKKAAAYKPAQPTYRPALASAARGGMRPIVE